MQLVLATLNKGKSTGMSMSEAIMIIEIFGIESEKRQIVTTFNTGKYTGRLTEDQDGVDYYKNNFEE